MSSFAHSLASVYRQAPSRSLIALEWLTGGVFAATLIAPRGTFIYLILWAVAVLFQQAVGTGRDGDDTRAGAAMELPNSPGATVAWVALAVLLSYAAATSFLVEPELEAWLRKPFQAAAVGVACWIICYAFAKYEAEPRWYIARGVLHGFIIGAVYIAIEHGTGGAIKATATNTTGLFPVGANANIVEDGRVVEIGAVFLNRHTAALAILVWAAGFAAMFWLSRRTIASLVALAFVVAAAIALACVSLSETAKLALLAGVLTGILVRYVPTGTLRLVQTGWILLVLGIIPLIVTLLPAQSPLVAAMPYSAKDRIVIWHYTINRLDAVPVLGHGAASTPLLASKKSASDEKTGLVPRLSRHAHNVYLQTWFELGGLGALLLLIVGLGVLSSIGATPATAQPLLLAQFVAVASVALTGYGMWQAWLLSVVALAVCVMTCLAHGSLVGGVSSPRWAELSER